nr:hypothetical protein [Tanacetum cinerariifolium]
YFDALLDGGSKVLHSIEGTILKEKSLRNIKGNSKSESDTEEPPFEKIIFNTDYKIKTSLEEPPLDVELKPLPNHLEYVFLEEPSFLPEKCYFMVKEGIVLGHKVSGEGLEVDKAIIDITPPLTKLLEKDTPFEFNDEYHKAFNSLKEKLTCTLVILSPNWNLLFELIVGNKMHKAFPLPVIKFPLAEEVPTASVEGCHCLKKSKATARKIALLC